MDATGLNQPTQRDRADATQPAPRGRRIKEPVASAVQASETSTVPARSKPTSRPDSDVAPPLDPDGVRTAQVGTGLWAAALVMLLPFYGWLDQTGRLWWLWVCFAGLGLGLIGIDLCRQRRDRTTGPQFEPSDVTPGTSNPYSAGSNPYRAGSTGKRRR